jgi:hypothetical protein
LALKRETLDAYKNLVNAVMSSRRRFAKEEIEELKKAVINTFDLPKETLIKL